MIKLKLLPLKKKKKNVFEFIKEFVVKIRHDKNVVSDKKTSIT